MPGLRGARDAYALYVVGSSMEPRYRAGEVVFVHPHRPLRAGDICIVQTTDFEDGDLRGWIKEFVRFTDKGALTRQYNPPAEVEFRRAAIKAMHRVLTPNEIVGV